MGAATSYATLYPLIRGGALFVMIIGTAIMIGSISFRFRNTLLCLGAAIAVVATALSAQRLAAPFGVPTAAQVAWLATAVLAEVVLLVVVIPRVARRGERAVVLAILLIVGVHFLPMAPTFGPLAVALGVSCAGNALIATRFSSYPLRAVWAVDGALKTGLGMLMWWMPVIGSASNATV